MRRANVSRSKKMTELFLLYNYYLTEYKAGSTEKNYLGLLAFAILLGSSEYIHCIRHFIVHGHDVNEVINIPGVDRPFHLLDIAINQLDSDLVRLLVESGANITKGTMLFLMDAMVDHECRQDICEFKINDIYRYLLEQRTLQARRAVEHKKNNSLSIWGKHYPTLEELSQRMIDTSGYRKQ